MNSELGSDYQLLLELFSKDSREAARLLQIHREMITTYFDFKGTGIAEAERLSDQVFDIVMRNLQNGETIENIKAYIFTVAKYLWLNHYKTTKRTESRFIRYGRWLMSNLFHEGQENDLSTAEHKCRGECLSQMYPTDRELLVEYTTANGKSRELIAQREGMSRSALSTKINRWRNSLRKCYVECMKRSG